jgi:Fe-S oxidoreductase
MEETHFSFPEDNGSFSYAMERCVGIGKCRRMEGGTMCPSHMVTREEMHSTRGRARLLFELLQGEAIGKNGWHDDPMGTILLVILILLLIGALPT